MGKWAYYNEIDLYCIEWTRNLISAGLVPDGEVDNRPIEEVQPEDVKDFKQCHFFSGILGWPLAARLAGWPDDRPVWTGSCPCQPFSVAGRRKGVGDPRHLWPDFYRLIRASRPVVVLGEQVSGAAGYAWLAGVGSDLEAEGYAWRAVDIPACAVGAPHRRSRLYWVADTLNRGSQDRRHEDHAGDAERHYGESPHQAISAAAPQLCADGLRLADTDGSTGLGGESRAGKRTGVARLGDGLGDAECDGRDGVHERFKSGYLETNTRGDGVREISCVASGATASGGFWSSYALVGPDPKGKYRRVKPGVCLLAHGIPSRVAKLRALGNAIVPELAAEVVRAYMETR